MLLLQSWALQRVRHAGRKLSVQPRGAVMKVAWVMDFKADPFCGWLRTEHALMRATPDWADVMITTPDALLMSASGVTDPDVVVLGRAVEPKSDRLLTMIDKFPTITIEHGWDRVSPRGKLIDGESRFLSEPGWGRAMRVFWTHENRRRSWFFSEEQLWLHVGFCESVGIDIERGTFERMLPAMDPWRLLEMPAERQGWLVPAEQPAAKGVVSHLQPEYLPKMLHPLLLERMVQAQGVVICPSEVVACPRLLVEAMAHGCACFVTENALARSDPWMKLSVTGIRAQIAEDILRFWESVEVVCFPHRTASLTKNS